MGAEYGLFEAINQVNPLSRAAGSHHRRPRIVESGQVSGRIIFGIYVQTNPCNLAPLAGHWLEQIFIGQLGAALQGRTFHCPNNLLVLRGLGSRQP